jgi:biopolymer transport protein ExbD
MLRVRRRPPEAEINLTPLIDVVFLLLIFFMISTQFKSAAELELELPNTDLTQVSRSTEALRVVVTQNGQLALEGRRLDNSAQSLRQALSQYPDAQDRGIVLEADARATHQSVVDVLSVFSELNITRIAIASRPGAQDER